MSMMTLEITDAVAARWAHKQLGMFSQNVGLYTAKIRESYEGILDDPTNSDHISIMVLWVLAHTWALLRWYTDLDQGGPGHWTEEDKAAAANSPMPREDELTTYPLEFPVTIDWSNLPVSDYIMMLDTYSHLLRHAWQYDYETFWSDDSAETARHLFQICKQYLLEHGVVEENPITI